MFVLQGQYNNEGNFTFENLAAAKNRLHHWRNLAALRWQTFDTIDKDDDKNVTLVAAIGAIKEAMDDNLNTPEALRIVDEAFSRIDSKALGKIRQHGLAQLIEAIDAILGLQLADTTPDIDEDTKQIIIQRERARDNKDWKTSDELRGTLADRSIAIRDTTDGSIWEYAEK
jgi:cysteinyl-tRNA synthetase